MYWFATYQKRYPDGSKSNHGITIEGESETKVRKSILKMYSSDIIIAHLQIKPMKKDIYKRLFKDIENIL